MATQYSVDPNQNYIVITVLFMQDGYIGNIEDFEPSGRVYVGGDVINFERVEGNAELAVVLGAGDTELEAENQARIYMKRLMKWHGQEDGQIMLFGHDLTQSQLFTNDEGE